MKNEYLKLLYRHIVIGPTDGKVTLAGAGDVFRDEIDSNFVNLGTNVPGKPTEEAIAQIFRVIKDGTFSQLFGSFDNDLDKLCWEQEQIISFVNNYLTKYPNFAGEYAIFFLFKVEDKFFIASVCRTHKNNRVFLEDYQSGEVFPGGGDAFHCIVVPQL